MNLLQNNFIDYQESQNKFDMDIIFLIKRQNSDYDGHNTTITYRTSLEEADAYVKEMNEVYSQSLEVIKFYQEKYWSKFHELKEFPKYAREEFLNTPKWKSGINQSEVTTEMRDERNKIKKTNEEIEYRNGEKLDEIRQLSDSFAEGLTKKFITDSGFDSRSFKKENEYYLGIYYVKSLQKI